VKSSETAVIALGGNAVLQPGQIGAFEEQLVNIDDCARRIAAIVAAGYEVLVVHGNAQASQPSTSNELKGGHRGSRFEY